MSADQESEALLTPPATDRLMAYSPTTTFLPSIKVLCSKLDKLRQNMKLWPRVARL